MNLQGHQRITQQAVLELRRECPGHPLTMGLGGAALDERVVLRDVYDVINTGHWQNFAQEHHFMRRFDRQSPYQAYQEGVAWVRSNAREASIQLMRNIPRYVSQSRSVPAAATATECSLPAMHAGNHRAMLLYTGSDTEGPGTLTVWQHFGNALHALQDSFAPGHVTRAPSVDDAHPGAIRHISRYAGTERDGHEEGDRQWQDGEGFSRIGRLATGASKDLIRIVLTAAIDNHRGIRRPEPPFDAFQQLWLAAAPELSRA
jgi:hypothetical protein